MSTDSHDQTKPCKTAARSEEESAFDGKRIKKERGDICAENGDAATAAVAVSTSTASSATSAAITTTTTSSAAANVVDRRHPPAGRFASNGFHGDGNLLQDLFANQFGTLANHSASSKQEKIRIMIEDSIRLSGFSIFF